MKQANATLRQPFDKQQLAILVSLCVAVYREMLSGSNSVDRKTNDGNTGKMGSLDGISPNAISSGDVGLRLRAFELPAPQVQENHVSDQSVAATQEKSEQMPPKLLLSIEEGAQLLGIGRSLMYELVRRGELASITIGRVRRIPVIELEAYVHRRLDASADRPVSEQLFRQKHTEKGDEAA